MGTTTMLVMMMTTSLMKMTVLNVGMIGLQYLKLIANLHVNVSVNVTVHAEVMVLTGVMIISMTILVAAMTLKTMTIYVMMFVTCYFQRSTLFSWIR